MTFIALNSFVIKNLYSKTFKVEIRKLKAGEVVKFWEFPDVT